MTQFLVFADRQVAPDFDPRTLLQCTCIAVGIDLFEMHYPYSLDISHLCLSAADLEIYNDLAKKKSIFISRKRSDKEPEGGAE